MIGMNSELFIELLFTGKDVSNSIELLYAGEDKSSNSIELLFTGKDMSNSMELLLTCEDIIPSSLLLQFMHETEVFSHNPILSLLLQHSPSLANPP